jgi:acetoin utilization deacetylase AcuC-like enzyme
MGNFVTYRESPSRAIAVLQSCKNNNMEIIGPNDFGLDPILAIHTKEYTEYLRSAYKSWVEMGGNPQGVIPDTYCVRFDPGPIVLSHNEARPGYYSFDSTAVVVNGTYDGYLELKKAAYEAVQVAITAAHELYSRDIKGSFALCRPPGHHASSVDYYFDIRILWVKEFLKF